MSGADIRSGTGSGSGAKTGILTGLGGMSRTLYQFRRNGARAKFAAPIAPELAKPHLAPINRHSFLNFQLVHEIIQRPDVSASPSMSDRPLAGEWPNLWLDATYLKQREGGPDCLGCGDIAVAVNTDGRREIVGLHIGPSEAETFWSTFLKSLARRGLHGVKLVIPDAHEGLKAAIRRVMGASWQRCQTPSPGFTPGVPSATDRSLCDRWMRNTLSYVPKAQQSMASAALRQAFIQPDRDGASQTLRHVADQLCGKWPKLGAFIDDSETDVLAHMDFPAQHRTKIHSTNPLERLNKEVKRRADVVGIFPNECSIIRLIGAVLLEANDEWQTQNSYMQIEAMAELTPLLINAELTQVSNAAA